MLAQAQVPELRVQRPLVLVLRRVQAPPQVRAWEREQALVQVQVLARVPLEGSVRVLVLDSAQVGQPALAVPPEPGLARG